MRLLIILFVTSMFIIMMSDIISVMRSEQKEIDNLKDPKKLIFHLKAPKGLEKEYKAILAGMDPYSVSAAAGEKKKRRSLAPKERVASKLKAYHINEDDHLIITEIVANLSGKTVGSDRAMVRCVVKNKERKPIDMFTKFIPLRFAPKEAIIIDGIDMGPISFDVTEAKYITCTISLKG